jgi:hypothetical protein
MPWTPLSRDDIELITATEIACFAYCPEQWRLEYGVGMASANQEIRDAGARHHADKAMGERIAGGSMTLGRVMLFLVFIGLLVALGLLR